MGLGSLLCQQDRTSTSPATRGETSPTAAARPPRAPTRRSQAWGCPARPGDVGGASLCQSCWGGVQAPATQPCFIWEGPRRGPRQLSQALCPTCRGPCGQRSRGPCSRSLGEWQQSPPPGSQPSRLSSLPPAPHLRGSLSTCPCPPTTTSWWGSWTPVEPQEMCVA